MKLYLKFLCIVHACYVASVVSNSLTPWTVALRATARGVPKSQTRLKQLSTHALLDWSMKVFSIHAFRKGTQWPEPGTPPGSLSFTNRGVTQGTNPGCYEAEVLQLLCSI